MPIPRAWTRLRRDPAVPAGRPPRSDGSRSNGSAFCCCSPDLLVPGVSDFIFGAAPTITDLLGISRPAIRDGWQAFHFWES
ncbi:hypothetical protein ACRAWD_12810 [Caulobacter segnis]